MNKYKYITGPNNKKIAINSSDGIKLLNTYIGGSNQNIPLGKSLLSTRILNQTKDKNTYLEEDLENCYLETDNLENINQELRELNNNLQEKIETINLELTSCKSLLVEKNLEYERSVKENINIKQSYKNSVKETKQLKLSNKELLKTIDSYENEFDNISAQNTSLTSEISSLNQELQIIINENFDLSNDNKLLNQKINKFENMIAKYQPYIIKGQASERSEAAVRKDIEFRREKGIDTEGRI